MENKNFYKIAYGTYFNETRYITKELFNKYLEKEKN